MTISWSTIEVPSHLRLPYWVDAVCDAFARLDCEPRRGQPFFGKVQSDSAGVARFCRVTGTAQIFTRSMRQLGRLPNEIICIAALHSGRGLITQDGRDAELRSGDLAVIDGNRPFRLSYDGDFDKTVLWIPRAMLVDRLGASECFTGRRIDGTTGIGGMLSLVVRELPSRLDTTPSEAMERISEHVLDLVATTLLFCGERRPPSAASTALRAKLWIEAHLSEELSANRIAGACKVSVRHLNRLFEREGTSLMHYVWERRLARCHRELTETMVRTRTIADIAFAAGFNDQSHFSRAYKARYGCAPRDDWYLADHRANSGSREQLSSKRSNASRTVAR
jgi:AraC-like DNA-binding protein